MAPSPNIEADAQKGEMVNITRKGIPNPESLIEAHRRSRAYRLEESTVLTPGTESGSTPTADGQATKRQEV